MMKTNMMEILQDIPLNQTISDFCYPISPLIKVQSGFLRITAVIEDYLKNQTHDWAEESIYTLNEEIQMVQHFYDRSIEEDQDRKSTRLNSSHVAISYAVFCFKTKRNTHMPSTHH